MIIVRFRTAESGLSVVDKPDPPPSGVFTVEYPKPPPPEPPRRYATCCEFGGDNIEWQEWDDGKWSWMLGDARDSESRSWSIDFCPWCGVKLPEAA